MPTAPPPPALVAAGPTRPAPVRPGPTPAPAGFEALDNPERLFDPQATLIMRAVTLPDPRHGMDVWIDKLLRRPVTDVVFTSPRGVAAAFRRAARTGSDFDLAVRLRRLRLLVQGADTARALKQRGLAAEVVAADAVQLSRRLHRTAAARRVAVQFDAGHTRELPARRHPVTLACRARGLRTYSVRVGTRAGGPPAAPGA